jgi:phospholipase D1/2
VQVLRSVGKWSIGTKVENSICRCWVESIQQAIKFIYIESQFFIGNTAGEGVNNTIPGTIVERIVKAFHEKQPFRVIVMVPIHPNGDFATAMKSKIVLHFQCLTINKGVSSMFAQLRARCPGIKIDDYIGFFSLRSWGVINNKVVSDQVYIHDKLLIVDDRVVVVGSANVNDRSMLGSRDSEVAIRIEDTLHLDIRMNGDRHTVGLLPHSLRMQLMRQHLGDQTIGK